MPQFSYRIITIILSFCCLALISCQKVQQAGNTIVIGETVIVPSKHLNKDMIIDVYLPDRYAEKSGRYPVLVTCQSHFVHVGGITADMARKNGAPEMIVASVRNYSSEDFIPEKVEGHPDSGGADRFIDFFRDELLPDLDSRYRTRPFRIFYSGSFGGGFAVYMFLTQPAVFNAYLAATPAVDYEGASSFIMNNVRTYLAKNSFQGRFLYLGVENEPLLIPVLEQFVGILKGAEMKGSKWEYRAFLDEDHDSIANRVIYNGLKFVFSEWTKIPEEIAGQGVGAVRTYASALRKKYGYDIGVSRLAIGMAARSYREQGRTKDAIDLLRLGLEYEPDSEMAWLQLGRALEANGELEQAKEALDTAHKMALRNSSPHLGIFRDALDKVNLKLAQE